MESFTQGISKEGTHKFIQITDTEIFNTQNHEDWINNLRNYSEVEQSTFIIHTGDICYENGLKEHIQLMNNSNMGRPVFYCIGNHDLVKGNYGEELYKSLYGPVFYSFDVGNIHYVVTPMLHGDHRPSYKKKTSIVGLKTT
ncbi:MAG: metallophosphoesterase [Odoribacter sp.]|nr:metallophosphoesterase [Odoribacter sp.]